MPKLPRRFWPLVIVFAVLVLLMPRTAKFSYDYKKGSPWPYETLVSQFDFPILKTEEQLQEERENAGATVIPYYRFSEELSAQVVKSVQGLDLGKHSYLRQSIVSHLGDIYSKGVLSDARVKIDRGYAEISDDVLYIQRNKRATKYPRSEVYKVSDAQTQLVAQLAKSYPEVNLDSLFRKGGMYDCMVPNLVFDKSMTELSHERSADYISPTSGYVHADQKIVSRGEIVTPEIAQMLDSYKAEYNKVFGYDGPVVLQWLGNILLALVLVAVLYFSIHFTNKNIFSEWRRYLYLLTVFTLTAALSFVVERTAPNFIYLVPFPVFALYLLAFFRDRVVLPVYTVALMPLLMFSAGGMELFVMYLTAGAVTIQTFKFFSRNWLQFVNALIVFAVELVVFAGFRLVDAGSSPVVLNVIQIFVGAIMTVAAYPLIYLFERLFNLVSTTRLLELADTNNPLLQELSNKAPGTFQHCLQVMNMVDAVGRSVDANVPLLRAAALYHDVGKIRCPLCFIENESSTPGAVRYHDGKSPLESARDIIRHVEDGVAVARENGIPGIIQDFIRTHHGTTDTEFFKTKYLNDGGDPAELSAFSYPGPRPTTKEQVILMICDSVEAASRTLKEYTPEAFDSFVERIVSGKEKAGQLEDADITIHELNEVKSVLKIYLQQQYHGRIEYPKRRK